MVKRLGLVLIAVFGLTNGHVAYWNTPNKLQPVHGLYVKPSVDGTTGDLYVAATEESGTKSQWLTEQPISFLPAASQTVPVAYSPNIILPEDASNPQKRAVINTPLQYAYAYPQPGQEGAAIMPYPYAIPTPTVANPSEISNKDAPKQTTLPQYQYLYPQMLSAYASLLNTFKEAAGVTAEAGDSGTTQAPPVWPYTYPVQYVMVDPSMWAQSQAVSVQPTLSNTATNAAVSDNE